MMARSPAPSDCCFAGIFMQMRRFLLHLVCPNETCFIPAASASRAKLPETCGGTWVGANSAAIRREFLLMGLKNICVFTQCVSRTLFVLGRSSFYTGTAGSAFRAKLGFNVLLEDSFINIEMSRPRLVKRLFCPRPTFPTQGHAFEDTGDLDMTFCWARWV